jgi:hypothetical protein
MSQERHRPELNAGAFMGPDIMIPAPTRPLGIDPEPKEPASEADVPAAPAQAGFAERLIRRLTGRKRPGQA